VLQGRGQLVLLQVATSMVGAGDVQGGGGDRWASAPSVHVAEGGAVVAMGWCCPAGGSTPTLGVSREAMEGCHWQLLLSAAV
jgi:hypothetical protein